MGALGGAAVGAKKLGDLAGPATKFVAKGLTKAGPFVRNVGGQAGRGVSVANATTLALQNMTGQQARKVTDKATEEIQAAVARGQPQYAATFQALQSPETRQAVMVEEDDELVLETGDEE